MRMIAPRIFLLVAALAALPACQTGNEHKPTAAERRGITAVLAGEWVEVGHSDEYLLFKPDEMDPKSGRFGGMGGFDRFEIKSRLILGRSIKVELYSASADTDTPKITVGLEFSADGRTLIYRAPETATGKAGPVRTYRKVVI